MSPTPDTPVANNTPFVRNLVARALRLPPTMDASAFDTTPSQLAVAEENNETSERASKSTGPLSSNTLAFNRKRRASALEGAATNGPQHSHRIPASVANENEVEDCNGEERNGSVVVGLPSHTTELEDYDEEERSGSVVAGLPTLANELEDHNEQTLDTSSDARLPPSLKKLCTGLSSKVLVLDGETFVLPEGRGDVVTLERAETTFERLGHMMHSKVIVIDGQRFLLPRGGGEVVALGEMEQRELNHTGSEEEDHRHGQETDSELEGLINNYHCYMDGRYDEGQELEDEEGQQEEQEVNDLSQFWLEDVGSRYFPDVEEGEQTMQSDSAEASSEKSSSMYRGENHSSEPEEKEQSEQSGSDDSELAATRVSAEQVFCIHCGGYHNLPEDAEESTTEQGDSNDSDSVYPLNWEHDEEEQYDEQDANAEPDTENEVPPTDSGYDSEMDDSSSSSSSSYSSHSDPSSDESFDYDYYDDGDGDGDATAQRPAVVVDDPILYGPTDLPEGHVRGEMMFVLNGELWGIDFTN